VFRIIHTIAARGRSPGTIGPAC